MQENGGMGYNRSGSGGNVVTRSEWDQNGFIDRDDSTISFVDGSRTFTIAPVVDNFEFYVVGKKYTKTASEDFIISIVGGIHIIYYDAGVLTESVNPDAGEVSDVIQNYAIVCIIYWDATNSEAIYVGEERHGCRMSPVTHAYEHFTEGLRYLAGSALNTMDVDGDGNDATAAQFGIDVGEVADEDLFLPIDAVSALTGLPVYYMIGPGAWERDINAGFSVVTTGTGRLAYNQYVAGAWQLTEVTNANFVLYHVFATTEKDTPMISIVGQNIYLSRRAAREGAEAEIHSLVLNDVLFPEIRPIATIIFQTRDVYGNAVKARVVSTDDGQRYVDWRTEIISRVVAGTSHSALSGLQNDDHYNVYVRAYGRDEVYATYAALVAALAPSATYRFAVAYVAGGAGVRDKMYACMKSDGDAYVWVEVVNGGI